MKKFLLGLTVYLTLTAIYAQTKRANHWYFGERVGIDFTGGSGILDTNNVIYSYEACSVISDTSGNLLFYTNGDTVWDRTHNIMPNGTGLMGCNSSSQGALIVPKPNDNNIYYIFTTDCSENSGNNGLRYSIVDISLNGGIGDIVGKNIVLISPTTEQLNAVRHCNGTDIWIAVHELLTDRFYSYLVTSTGINITPVISIIGPVYLNPNPICILTGEFKFSPNGKKLGVTAASCLSPFLITELYDFNNQTGIISNYISLPTDSLCYGVSFSPDNSKLYFSYLSPGSGIFQYDLTDTTSSAIVSSKTQIFSSANVTLTGLQLSPDNKIYVTRFMEDTLGIIQNPNSLGLSCNYVNSGLNLNGRICHETFPNFIESLFSTNNDTCQTIGLPTNENYNAQTLIYPNPFSTQTIIQTNNFFKNATLTVYNSLVQQVRQLKNISGQTIALQRDNLSSGLYLLQLTQDGKILTTNKILITDR